MNSGFCNPNDRAVNQNHRACPGTLGGRTTVDDEGVSTLVGATECECTCHVHYYAVWIDWMEEAQTMVGFSTEQDARIALAAMRAQGYIPEAQDGDELTDVVPYRGDAPW